MRAGPGLASGCCAFVPLLLAGAQRRALFPGLCCYPMSPHVGSDFASAEAQDQLNMIFDLLGTPTVRFATCSRRTLWLESRRASARARVCVCMCVCACM